MRKAKELQNAHETSENIRKPELYTCCSFSTCFPSVWPNFGALPRLEFRICSGEIEIVMSNAKSKFKMIVPVKFGQIHELW